MKLGAVASGAAVLIAVAMPAWAAGGKLILNGKVASNNVKTVAGQAVVPLADLAKSLGMVVVRNANGSYEIRMSGGTNPIRGVTQGKIGDVLFDGQWRFQVLKMETLDSFTMKSDADTYDSAGLSRLNRDTHVLQPKSGYKLIVLQCRLTNGRNIKRPLWTAISDDKMNTALTDMDGGSHPPVAYDFNGAPTQTTPLLPGAMMTFPIIFSVPADIRLKDLVFTLRANDAGGVYNNVRVSLPGGASTPPARWCVTRVPINRKGNAMTRNQSGCLVLFALATATSTFAGYALAAEEHLGTVRQPLVGGTLIDEKKQEEFGLLTFSDSGTCSASLLRNDWAITAAHCVETNGTTKPIPDPARPGQFMLNPPAGITLSATWGGGQDKAVTRVETFRPYDVALLKVASPFKVRGSTTNYSRLIFQDGQFPYFGTPVGADLLIFGRGISQFATGSGASAMPSVRDGLYRIGYARCNREEANRYWYPSEGGQMIAGGDSGGPSFAWVLGGYALVGVHSSALTERVPGKPTTGWDWVTRTTEAADAPIAPVWDQIFRIIGPAPAAAPAPDDLPNTQTGNVGTFTATPKNYQPLWIYAIRPNGVLVWYRKDSGAAPWQGPKDVGYGWAGFKDVIPAGGNSFYVLNNADKLVWYQHNGFNDGTFNWKGPVEVGSGWTFKKIFSGGEGIVYAIRQDGKLIWYKNNGADYGVRDWQEAKEVGSGWADFKDVFSTGQGHIYAVRQDGTLWSYLQKSYASGAKSWYTEKQIGSGWGDFQQIVPAGVDGDGNDVILAIQRDGKLLWYRWGADPPKNRLTRIKMRWEGPVQIGSGWQDFAKVIALIPTPAAGLPVVR
jgi:hypothetical protein